MLHVAAAAAQNMNAVLALLLASAALFAAAPAAHGALPVRAPAWPLSCTCQHKGGPQALDKRRETTALLSFGIVLYDVSALW